MYRWPNWLYEPLPYLYLFVGVGAVVGIDPMVGRFSGLLLITAAMLIIMMRRDYRACSACQRYTGSD